MPQYRVHGYITLGILIVLLAVSGIWYASSPIVYNLEVPKLPILSTPQPLYEGDYIVVNSTSMKVELKNGSTTLETFDILSVGKPGSYYETIGGAHVNDYKIKRHFSSIGHVYMPYAVHVFGNYFIHGVPFYASGKKVSSEYSGGCVRLTDEDAKRVYEFVQKGTPIIITDGSEKDFLPTATSTPDMLSIEMTHLMVATISLEVLPQDNEIKGTDGMSLTTRRTLLPRLIEGDDQVAEALSRTLGEATFLDYMNHKATALGLTNTHFSSLTEPVSTTREDYKRFTNYIVNYKTYLVTIASTTALLSQ